MNFITFVLLVAWSLQLPLLLGLLVGRAWLSAGVAAAILAVELYVICGG